jgi:hypothetical protein
MVLVQHTIYRGGGGGGGGESVAVETNIRKTGHLTSQQLTFFKGQHSSH